MLVLWWNGIWFFKHCPLRCARCTKPPASAPDSPVAGSHADPAEEKDFARLDTPVSLGDPSSSRITSPELKSGSQASPVVKATVELRKGSSFDVKKEGGGGGDAASVMMAQYLARQAGEHLAGNDKSLSSGTDVSLKVKTKDP